MTLTDQTTALENQRAGQSTDKHSNHPGDHTEDGLVCNNHQLANSSPRFAFFSNVRNSLARKCKWCPTSGEELAKAEKDLLKCLDRAYKLYFVDIGNHWGRERNQVRTLEMLDVCEDGVVVDGTAENHKQSSETTTTTRGAGTSEEHKRDCKRAPLVLIHGFGSGLGTWILNLDELTSTSGRKIYAIDIIGFARSSRTPFDLAGDVEGQFVESVELWREKMNLDKMILLGHSFGGYLSTLYAMRHPERVAHLILADPWGFQERQQAPRRKFPLWVRALAFTFRNTNPLAVWRISGPYGLSLVQKVRADLREKFRPKLGDECHKFLVYIYHCNTQEPPTGENAFMALVQAYGWAKSPLVNRLKDLHPSVSMTVIYGGQSWVGKAPDEERLSEALGPNRVRVHTIEASGHHVYADEFAQFNELVRETCAKVGH